MGKKEQKRLKLFAKQLQKTAGSIVIGTNTLTPINYSIEKKKFLQNSDTYNPQFNYQTKDTTPIKKELDSLSDQLKYLTLPKEIKIYLHEFIDTLQKGTILLEQVGSEEFGKTADSLFQFGKIDAEYFLKHISSLTFNEPKSVKLHSAKEIKKQFLKHMENLGIEDFEVSIDHFNDHIVRVGHNKLIIGSQVKRFCNNVERLIVHEIESHVLQRYNMTNNQNPLLRLSPPRENMLWGEGLAVYNEIQSGTITRSAYETYYLRLKSVEMLHREFKDIFDYLVKFVSPEKAFMITYRVKRGMGNTQLPGGYPKDASYLLGYKMVAEYIENGGNLEFLYISRNPRLGELLMKYNLLDGGTIVLPQFLQKSSVKNAHLYQNSLIH